MRVLGRVLFIFILLCLLSPLLAQTTNSAPKEGIKDWPEEVYQYFRQTIPNQLHSFGDQISNALFDVIDDYNILDKQFGLLSLKLNSKREIFDNRDLFNSWTVLDRFRINMGATLFSTSLQAGAELPVVNLSLGIGGEFEYYNVRQVLPKNFPDISSLSERENEIKFYRDQDSETSLPPNLVILPNRNQRWYQLDQWHRAQYGQIIKRLIIPLRIPMKVENLKGLDNGEIISFTASGNLSLGANLNLLALLGANIPLLRIGPTSSIFIKGSYRFNIMKESEHFARIKLTRGWGYGRGVGLEAKFDQIVAFEGLTIGPIKNSGKTAFTITPFRFNISKDNSHFFDITYRYDLRTPEAQIAYEKAMEGDLSLSEEMFQDAVREGRKLVVEKLFTRKTKGISLNHSQGMNWGNFFKAERSRIISINDSRVNILNGSENQLLKMVSENKQSWRNYFSQFERWSYNFSIFANVGEYQNGKEDSIGMIIETTIDDSTTSGRELLKYSKLVEKITSNKKPIFPRVPLTVPPPRKEDCEGKKRFRLFCIYHALLPNNAPAYYGRSSFYAKLGLRKTEIEKFFTYPNKKMWHALEVAFSLKNADWEHHFHRNSHLALMSPLTLLNIPLNILNLHIRPGSKLIHAIRMHYYWQKAKNATEIKDKLVAMAHLFSDHRYGKELIQLTKVVMENRPIAYSLRGNSRIFGGPITLDGWNVNVIDHLSQHITRDMDFEQPQAISRINENLRVNDLQVKVVTSERIKPEQLPLIESSNSDYPETVATPVPLPQTKVKIQTEFSFSEVPRIVYFKISRSGNWQFDRPLKEIVVFNRGEFVKGKNNLEILTGSSNELSRELASELKLGKFYTLTLAFSLDGKTWGPASNKEFILQRTLGGSNH